MSSIRVNPIDCEAHGLCAEILPERVTLDEWGYPIVDGTPIPRNLMVHARRAVSMCPTLALRLARAEDGEKPLESANAGAGLRQHE